MTAARVIPGLLALALVGAGFVACGGKVSIDDGGDAGTDASPTTTPTTTATPTSTPTGTAAPACPTYRPIRGTPCFNGLHCTYPCSAGYTTAIKASCASGTWVIATTETCGSPPLDCEACQNKFCAGEIAACRRSDAVLRACTDLFKCITGCTDDWCKNTCISDSHSDEGKAVVSCVVENCSAVCPL